MSKRHLLPSGKQSLPLPTPSPLPHGYLTCPASITYRIQSALSSKILYLIQAMSDVSYVNPPSDLTNVNGTLPASVNMIFLPSSSFTKPVSISTRKQHPRLIVVCGEHRVHAVFRANVTSFLQSAVAQKIFRQTPIRVFKLQADISQSVTYKHWSSVYHYEVHKSRNCDSVTRRHNLF